MPLSSACTACSSMESGNDSKTDLEIATGGLGVRLGLCLGLRMTLGKGTRAGTGTGTASGSSGRTAPLGLELAVDCLHQGGRRCLRRHAAFELQGSLQAPFYGGIDVSSLVVVLNLHRRRADRGSRRATSLLHLELALASYQYPASEELFIRLLIVAL